MKKVAMLILVMFIASGGAEILAVKKVPKSGSKDTTKSKTSEKVIQKTQDQQKTTKSRPSLEKRFPVIKKDSFIDSNGDGINDNIKRRQAPEVKRDKVAKKSKPQKLPEKKPSKVKSPERKRADDKALEKKSKKR